MALCELRLEQRDAAAVTLRQLESDYPADVYTMLARQLWEVYGTAGLGKACQAVTAYALEHPDAVGFWYGQQSPGHTWGEAVVVPGTICSANP